MKIAAGRAGASLAARTVRAAVAVLAKVSLLAAVAILTAGGAMARDAQPLARIPLEPMGYQTVLPDYLLGGSSMLTVDFVDREHLLVTFGVHRLMRREADDPPGDDDHVVEAALVELPSGKLLARTDWRLHDRGRYLWSLGHGRFLLRVRDRLTVLAPLEAARADDAFRQSPLPSAGRHIVALMVSPNRDLLTVETTGGEGASADLAGQDPAPGGAAPGSPATTDAAPVRIDFYRMTSTGDSADGLALSSAGAVLARTVVDLPMTTAGFLDAVEGGKDRWLLNFDQNAGKVTELAEFDTTCFPRPTFVGHDEFVVFGCMGGTKDQALAGFNLTGEEMWQQGFYDTHVAATFAFAPAAGRFALGWITVAGAVGPGGTLPENVASTQEVRVMQGYDGRLLLRIDCSPVARAGQNFALSADGSRLAVVRQSLVQHPATKEFYAYTERETAVEVYALPQLTAADEEAVKQAEAMAPRDVGARIDLSLERLSTPAVASEASGGTSAPNSVSGSASVKEMTQTVEPGAGASTVGGAATGTVPGTVFEGDPVPGVARKRPTLYGPDEMPAQEETPAQQESPQ